MNSLDKIIEWSAIAVVAVLALAFYERSIAARYSASQDAALANLETNAGNSVLGAIFGGDSKPVNWY